MSSYASPGDATTYFETRLGATAWEEADFRSQQASLADATRLIDMLRLQGNKAVKDQELRFPREGQEALDPDPASPTYNTMIPTVPNDVKVACMEIALALLDGIDPEEEYMLLSQSSTRYANISKRKTTVMAEPHVLAGIPSLRAFNLLIKYLRHRQTVYLERNS